MPLKKWGKTQKKETRTGVKKKKKKKKKVKKKKRINEVGKFKIVFKGESLTPLKSG